ncbi:MAG: FdhF/YdeP family oxidoreductase [Planctomycetes bacterium]|nr:FdhF/YdeP family oxidoreductase [Planctomycetota bacterium]
MVRPRVSAGGGMAALRYSLKKAREAGGFLKLWKRLRSKNACKTCALGMGGQKGGMVNEKGHFPEVCKKSIQAQAGDMQAPISEDYFRRTPITAMARLDSHGFEHLGRLAFPIVAEPGATHFRRASWEEAYAKTAEALKAAPPHEAFFYASGRASNEAAFLWQLVARAYGSPNVHNCSFYCHQASGVALNEVYGSGTASIVLEDLDRADLAFVIGANPASNHPRLMTKLVQLRRRGGVVIVVNPLKELGLVRFRVPSDVRSMLFGSTISDLYLQPRVGSDIALLKALLKGVLERNALDQRFLEERTSGWDAVRADVEATRWETLLEACGLARAEVDRCVELLCRAKAGIGLWAMGLTHHQHGVDNVLALANLWLARGWLGVEGAGLLPIRGHSNVQGVGSVGVAPTVKAAFAKRLEELYQITVPSEPGQDTFASMVAAQAGKIRVALCLGGNLYASNPDLKWAREALQKVPFSFSLTTKLNEGHVHGRGQTAFVVPVLARDEEAQPTTQESMFNYVRLSDGGKPAVAGEMRSEVEIVAELASRVLPKGRFDWQRLKSHTALREEIAKVVPGYEAIATIERTKAEFQIPGRTMHGKEFATKDGKAHFAVTPVPDTSLAPDEFRMMTLRSEGQFNTVVYDVEDLYRGNDRRDVVMMCAADAERLGLREGQRVLVASELAAMQVSVALVDIAPRSLAMYYPEANAIVPGALDARSKTPAFKNIRVKLRPVGAAR